MGEQGNEYMRAEVIGQCAPLIPAVDDALYAIGGKWKLRIITAVLIKDMRFNELQRSVKGISARVLSNELKELELNGFVAKKLEGETVMYSLTAYSHTLHKVIMALGEWGKMHRQTIQQKG